MAVSVDVNRRYGEFAAIAQLGERQTEDLKVPGSIPGGGILIFFFPTIRYRAKVLPSELCSLW